MPSARSTTARPATRTRADPASTAMSTGTYRHPSRGSPKRIVRRGSRRRLGRLAFVAGERARRLPRLGEDPGAARRLRAGACRRPGPRSTGFSARATRAVPRPGRHEPTEPIVGTLESDSGTPAQGERLLAGLPVTVASITTARVTAWKGTGGATAEHAGRIWIVKRAMRGLPIGQATCFQRVTKIARWTLRATPHAKQTRGEGNSGNNRHANEETREGTRTRMPPQKRGMQPRQPPDGSGRSAVTQGAELRRCAPCRDRAAAPRGLAQEPSPGSRVASP